MASANPKHNQPHPAPFAAMRRRTILACSNCRKRKIRCMTTEQPPRNPCARCVKKNLPCEYVAALEPDYSSSPRPQSPDTTGSPGSNSGTDSSSSSAPMRWASPMTPPSFLAGQGSAPPLPYTGPPPVTRTATGWRYSPPSRHGPKPPGSSTMPLPASSSRASTPGPGSNQAYAHSSYYGHPQAAPQYAPGYGNAQYDPQRQYIANPAYTSQPPLMQVQPGDYQFDFSEYLNDEEHVQGPSSSRYPSNNPRYN
ncbi:hypothetical protein FB451DRAFT_1360215 [Mycena latifolia]|nr:hypothetical protein FB451DRAFT_1360215 [Mycena latifolia]